MKFYSSIADYYDYIFPDSRMKVSFIQSCFGSVRDLSFLDIGCATGKAAAALANISKQVNAIDIDSRMIEKAKQNSDNHKNPPAFSVGDMTEIEKQFSPKIFDGIYCFGNTLVHLTDISQIEDFLQQVKKLLRAGGKFLLQIVNYDKVLNDSLKELPTIENKYIRFERRYELEKSSGLISFRATLNIKQTEEEIKHSTLLYPIRRSELEQILINTGFSQISLYDNFQGKDYTGKLQSLVAKIS